jgi:hypothetical protein
MILTMCRMKGVIRAAIGNTQWASLKMCKLVKHVCQEADAETNVNDIDVRFAGKANEVQNEIPDREDNIQQINGSLRPYNLIWGLVCKATGTA